MKISIAKHHMTHDLSLFTNVLFNIWPFVTFCYIQYQCLSLQYLLCNCQVANCRGYVLQTYCPHPQSNGDED